MQVDRLVTMANDIAAFFHGAASSDAAAGSVADHLRRFWDPRMRSALVTHWQAGGAGLSELSQQAVALLAGTTRQTAPVPATHRKAAPE